MRAEIVEDGPPDAVLGNPQSERLRQFLSNVLYDERLAVQQGIET